jgi:hypothetical protein
MPRIVPQSPHSSCFAARGQAPAAVLHLPCRDDGGLRQEWHASRPCPLPLSSSTWPSPPCPVLSSVATPPLGYGHDNSSATTGDLLSSLLGPPQLPIPPIPAAHRARQQPPRRAPPTFIFSFWLIGCRTMAPAVRKSSAGHLGAGKDGSRRN